MRLFTFCIYFFCLLILMACIGCESCIYDVKKKEVLSLPFVDDFNRPFLGEQWRSEMKGRWNIVFDERSKQGKVCVEQARNNPLFLTKSLPRDVIIEFDAWAKERDGDVKAELFTNGKMHATGYVLVHGGWHNARSIIDRRGEHHKNCRGKQHSSRVQCRRWKKGGPEQFRRYHWKIIRVGEKLQWFLDGTLFMEYHDPSPLEGNGHEYFGFSNWIAHVCFDQLRIQGASNHQQHTTLSKHFTQTSYSIKPRTLTKNKQTHLSTFQHKVDQNLPLQRIPKAHTLLNELKNKPSMRHVHRQLQDLNIRPKIRILERVP